MLHWNLDGMLLNRLQLELARAVAPEQDFHPQDADRLVAIGRGSATWPAWPGTTPSSRAGSTRPACSSPTRSPACSGGLRRGGEELVDTELVVALTEALAAAHNPFYGSGRLSRTARTEPRRPADVEECPLSDHVPAAPGRTRHPGCTPPGDGPASAWPCSPPPLFVAMAAYVWRRRGGSAGVALALVLVALLLWAGTYAAELEPPT